MKFLPKPYFLRIKMRKLWLIESSFSTSLTIKFPFQLYKLNTSIISRMIHSLSPINLPFAQAVWPTPVKNGSTF